MVVSEQAYVTLLVEPRFVEQGRRTWRGAPRRRRRPSDGPAPDAGGRGTAATVEDMSDLTPRSSGSRLSRRERERRAYRLVLASGGAGVATVVAAVLAVVDIVGFGTVLLLALITAALVVALRRTVGAR
jgi:hypothetical protein